MFQNLNQFVRFLDDDQMDFIKWTLFYKRFIGNNVHSLTP